MRALWLLPVLAACGRGHAKRPVRVDGGAASAVPAPARGEWIAGDLHEHVRPVDDAGAVVLDPDGVVALAKQRGLAFVVLTPHLSPTQWSDPTRRASWLAHWQTLVAAASQQHDVALLPGTEFGVPRLGHFGVVGADLAALCPTGVESACQGPHFLAAARAAGGFITVNHPFALPTHIPGFEVSHYDMSFRPWTSGQGDAPALDAVEIWNLPLSFANIVSTPGGQTGEARALAEADRLARSGRRVTLVGGSDNHTRMLWPTTWVRVTERTPAAILAALRAGAVCVGGPEAGSFEAEGDGTGGWQGIGGAVTAARVVTLRWHGRGELFVDGVSRGVHDDALTVEVGGGSSSLAGRGGVAPLRDAAMHTFRLVVGRSRSGFIYANLP